MGKCRKHAGDFYGGEEGNDCGIGERERDSGNREEAGNVPGIRIRK